MIEYTLRLRPEPGRWQRPPEQRLRAALKVLLRAFGFRCRNIAVSEPDKEGGQSDDADTTNSEP